MSRRHGIAVWPWSSSLGAASLAQRHGFAARLVRAQRHHECPQRNIPMRSHMKDNPNVGWKKFRSRGSHESCDHQARPFGHALFVCAEAILSSQSVHIKIKRIAGNEAITKFSRNIILTI